MRQIAIGVRKVGLELKRSGVLGNCLWNIARVLVNAGQIRVRIGEGGIDLNCPRVALQRSRNVAHFF